jgi:hypothetical protein
MLVLIDQDWLARLDEPAGIGAHRRPRRGIVTVDHPRPRRSASWLSRVLLPTVLGPLRTSTCSSAKRAAATSTRRRFARPVRT